MEQLRYVDRNGSVLCVGDKLTSTLQLNQAPLAVVEELCTDGAFKARRLDTGWLFYVVPEQVRNSVWVKVKV